MRKTFSILDEYGGVVQQFDGVAIETEGDFVLVYDLNEGEKHSHLKAIHRLSDGHTICHTEEVDG